MTSLTFSKMHGLGNDFMVVDLISQTVTLEPQQIRRWADRHTGIGFDQLLVVEAPTRPDADFRYRIYNADGSGAEQCGNGARCFAAFVRRVGLTTARHLTLQTGGDLIEVTLLDDELVEVLLPPPELTPAAVPFHTSHPGPIYPLDVAGETLDVVPVAVGNPHAVTFVAAVDQAAVERLGPQIERHHAFPKGVNAGFCEVVNRQQLRLRVFERGVGETRACGSGACAAAVAARITDQTEPRVKVSAPGGCLYVDWRGPGEPIKMSGPASHVYEGTVALC